MPGGPSIWAIRGPGTSGTQVKNGGTVLYGNASNTRVISNTQSSISLVGVDHAGFLNVPTQDTGAYGASGWKAINSNGSFGRVNARSYVIFQLMPVQLLANLSTTLLQTPGADTVTRRSINRNETIQTVKFVTAGWNYVTGKFLTTPSISVDSFGADDAARPTRALPGGLVYVDAGKTIITTDYKPKTD